MRHRKLLVLLISWVGWASFAGLPGDRGDYVFANEATVPRSLPETVGLLTTQLLEEAYRYHESQSAESLNVLRALASERRIYLEQLIQDDPGAVTRLFLPAYMVASLPSEIQSECESTIVEQGILDVLIQDYSDERKVLYVLNNELGSRWELHLATEPVLMLTSGLLVQVKGTGIGQHLVLTNRKGDFIQPIEEMP